MNGDLRMSTSDQLYTCFDFTSLILARTIEGQEEMNTIQSRIGRIAAELNLHDTRS